MAMLFLKLGALTIVHLVTFVAAYGALMPATPTPSGPEPIPALAGLLFVAFANSTVVSWIVRRSDALRWRLTFAIFLALWGIQTILAQVETVIFPGISERLPQGFVARAVLAGLVHAALFAFFAVWMLARRHRSADVSSPPLPHVEWLWRASVAAAVFVALYFTCGYFIAWRQPNTYAAGDRNDDVGMRAEAVGRHDEDGRYPGGRREEAAAVRLVIAVGRGGGSSTGKTNPAA